MKNIKSTVVAVVVNVRAIWNVVTSIEGLRDELRVSVREIEKDASDLDGRVDELENRDQYDEREVEREMERAAKDAAEEAVQDMDVEAMIEKAVEAHADDDDVHVPSGLDLDELSDELKDARQQVAVLRRQVAFLLDPTKAVAEQRAAHLKKVHGQPVGTESAEDRMSNVPFSPLTNPNGFDAHALVCGGCGQVIDGLGRD